MFLDSNPIPFPGIMLQKAKSEFYEGHETLVEIRGVSFDNTSATEQFVLQQLAALFNELGIFLANEPVGFWKYEDLKSDPAPLIGKYVSVMTTIGDRRLEAHLMTGMERYVRDLGEDELGQNLSSLEALFAARNIPFPGSDESNASFSKAIRLGTREIRDHILSHFNDLSDDDIPGLMVDDLRCENFISSEEILDVLSGTCREFVQLFGRIGWETGRCSAVLHRVGFLWGTFCDHSQSELHCNAHMDNFVVVPRSVGLLTEMDYQLLAPLDFDMAFAKEQAVSVWINPPISDPTIVAFHFAAEVTSLLVDLTGLRGCLPGISYPQKPRTQPEGNPNKLLWVARDVAAWEFVQAYQSPKRDRTKAIGLSGSAAFDLMEHILHYTKFEEA
jgi:hypothetical protein